MNDKRRKGIREIIDNLEALKSNDIFSLLEQYKEELETYKDEESEAYSNMSERFPEGENTEKLETSSNHLDDAYSALEDLGENLISGIEEVIESLNNAIE